MDLASEANALSEAIAEPLPEIRPTPDAVVQLFKGAFNPETSLWETTALVRELTGEDEEALAGLDTKLLYAEYMSFLLKRSVVSIGGINITNNPEVIDNLIIGDRDALFIGVVNATYGTTRDYQMLCRACNESNDIQVDTSTFKNRKVSHDPKELLKVSLKDGSTISLRIPTGADSIYVAKKAKTIPEQNTLLIERCVVWEQSDAKTPANTALWAKKLNMSDRSALVSALTANQPGPEIEEVNAHCAHCEEPFTMYLDWVSLLFG